MRVDTTNTRYHERPDARERFNRQEMRHCRQILRRLRFLEFQVNERGGLEAPDASGGAAFAEWEMAALEWGLLRLGFLKEVSGNTERG